MKFAIYDHRSGIENVPQPLREEVSSSISDTEVPIRKGASSDIRDSIVEKLIEKGWSSQLSVSKDSEMTITSCKVKVGLCLQTGNMARMYADILKLQKLYLDDAITAGVMIVPSKPVAQVVGDNVAHAERLVRELHIFRKVIIIPIVVFALE